jgi:hypothetical protein
MISRPSMLIMSRAEAGSGDRESGDVECVRGECSVESAACVAPVLAGEEEEIDRGFEATCWVCWGWEFAFRVVGCEGCEVEGCWKVE